MRPTWSTAGLPPRQQFGYWREMICEAFLDLTPEAERRDGFRGRVTQHSLGRLDLGEIESQAQQVRRTEKNISRSPMVGHYANLQVRGVGLTTQDGRTAVTHPGDITIVDTARPFAFQFRGDFRQLSLHIPDQLLSSQLVGPVPTATRLSTVSGVGAAVRHALHTIVSDRLEPTSAARLAVHTAGLLAVALDQPPHRPSTVTDRRHLLDAALADIDDHLADDDLSPPVTARRLGISVRLLHQLFAGRERTFSREVRLRRLEQAHHDLADPARAERRIIDIAVDAGFVDVTHFHRAFRQRYGYAPGHLRSGGPGGATG